mgnify:CR=1 FL=1
MPQRKWWYCGYHLYDWFETSWQKWYTFKLDNSWLNFLWIMPLFGLREFGYSFACEQSLCVYFDYLCLYRDKTNTCCSGASYCQDKTTLDWRYYWLSPFSDLENLVKVLHAINLNVYTSTTTGDIELIFDGHTVQGHSTVKIDNSFWNLFLFMPLFN